MTPTRAKIRTIRPVRSLALPTIKCFIPFAAWQHGLTGGAEVLYQLLLGGRKLFYLSLIHICAEPDLPQLGAVHGGCRTGCGRGSPRAGAVSYTHLDVYKRQVGGSQRTIIEEL